MTGDAAIPDAYVAGLDGWRRERLAALRAAVRAVAGLDEVIKWGHLVYVSNGPALLIRAEGQRVLLGFWRGQIAQDRAETEAGRPVRDGVHQLGGKRPSIPPWSRV